MTMQTQSTQGHVKQPQTQVLVPGERDFWVYRLVKVERQSTRGAAELAGISQTRVCQVVQRVAEYLASVAPAEKDAEREQRWLHVAKQTAKETLEYLSEQAILSFALSRDKKTTVTTTSQIGGEPVTRVVVREGDGDVRYLFAAGKLALMGAKLGVEGIGAAGQESGIGSQESDDAAAELKNPSEGDCSVEAVEQGVTAEAAVLPMEAKTRDEITYELYLKLAAEGKLPSQPTVQRPESQPPKTEKERARKAFFGSAAAG